MLTLTNKKTGTIKQNTYVNGKSTQVSLGTIKGFLKITDVKSGVVGLNDFGKYFYFTSEDFNIIVKDSHIIEIDGQEYRVQGSGIKESLSIRTQKILLVKKD